MNPGCTGQPDCALRANTRHRSREAASACRRMVGVPKLPDTTSRGSTPGSEPSRAVNCSTETICTRSEDRKALGTVPESVEGHVGHSEAGLHEAPAVAGDRNPTQHQRTIHAGRADVPGQLDTDHRVVPHVDGPHIAALLPAQDLVGCIGGACLLYTSDAADEEDSVDLGG